MRRSTCLALAAASLALSAPRIADACSPPSCWFGAFVPGDHGRVPANVPGLYWRPMFGFGAAMEPANVVLTTAPSPRYREVSIDLAPSAAAKPWIDALHFETLVDGHRWYYQNE